MVGDDDLDEDLEAEWGSALEESGDADPADDKAGEEGLDAIKRIDELVRSVRALRRAWVNERKRAWISVGCAGIVTVLALVIIVVS